MTLITETPNYDNIHFEVVSESKDTPKKYYIKGPFLKVDEVNLNNRIYESSEFIPAIDAYRENYIKKDRAAGELNHGNSPDLDLSRISHKVLSLERDGDSNYFNGKALLLDTPSGLILKQMADANLRFGISTKATGRIEESAKGCSYVKSPTLISLDAVYQPSVSKAIMDSVYENQHLIMGNDNRAHKAFSKFNKHLSKYPSHHSDAIKQHILEGFQKLLKSL